MLERVSGLGGGNGEVGVGHVRSGRGRAYDNTRLNT